MPQLPNVPVEACRFAADFSPGSAGDGKTVPFSCLARTADPIPHWYWGPRTVHDFSGMEAADSLLVDWCHDENQIMGVLRKAVPQPDGLKCEGDLIPFRPDDRASEVIYKSQLGVKYQASIFFDPFSMVVEDVPEGFTSTVNGQTLPGPLTIFRKWKLLGLAICPYGMDGGTDCEFSRKLSGQQVAVTRFSKGAPPVDGVVVPPVVSPAEPPPVVPPVTETVVPPVVPPTGATALSRKDQLKPFTDAFGEQHGVTLFSRCDTVAEAHVEYGKILKAENDALKAAAAKFAKPPAGGTTPASFGGAESAPVPTKFANLGSNLGRFAAGIKVPGR